MNQADFVRSNRIVITIAAIAAQTNLLVLNAAIEAAKRITDLVERTQSDTANAVSTMETGAGRLLPERPWCRMPVTLLRQLRLWFNKYRVK